MRTRGLAWAAADQRPLLVADLVGSPADDDCVLTRRTHPLLLVADLPGLLVEEIVYVIPIYCA